MSTPGRIDVGEFRHMALRVPDLDAAARAFAPVLGIPRWAVREGDGWRSAVGVDAKVGLELIEAAPGALGGLDRYGLSHAVFAPPPRGSAASGLTLHEPLPGYAFADTRAALHGLALAFEVPGVPITRTLDTPHEPALPVQKLYHAGVVVRDRDAAIADFAAAFGIGHFVRMELHTGDGFEVVLDGRPISHHARTCFGRVGAFSVELMEPTEGDGLYHRFLATHGEGPQHHFPSILSTAELEAALPRLARAGFTVALDGAFTGVLRYLYLAQTGLPGFALELIVPLRPDWWESMGMSREDAFAVGLDP
jgi:hypothetical protein